MKKLNNEIHYASIKAMMAKLENIVNDSDRNKILSVFKSIKNDQDEKAMDNMDVVLREIAGFYNVSYTISFK